MTHADRAEALALIESVRSSAPSYGPDWVRTLRLADLLFTAVHHSGLTPATGIDRVPGTDPALLKE